MYQRRNGWIAKAIQTICIGLLLAACTVGATGPASTPTPQGRSLADFSFLKLGMTYEEVVKVVGPADRMVGSGVIGYMYDLPDGSSLSLNFGPTGDSLWKVILVHADGTREAVLEGNP